VADRSVSIPKTLSNLERLDAMGQNFQADLHNNACTVSTRTRKFGGITHVGRGVFLVVSHAPTARGRGPALPSFGGSLLFLRTVHPLMHNYQIWRGNRHREGRVFRGQLHTTQWGGPPALPIFWSSSYLCLHPLSQNYQIWRADTW